MSFGSSKCRGRSLRAAKDPVGQQEPTTIDTQKERCGRIWQKWLALPPLARQREEARGQLATFLRDTLVGMNYAYYEPPGSQVLHHNPLFVRSHDFSGDTVIGVEQLWQSAELFGAGSPAGGGAHLIGSLADLPYVLAEAEQDFIAPDHVQALIWKQFVPGLLSSAIVPRWWDVSQNELHAVALYQRAGEELLTASCRGHRVAQ